MIYDQRLSTCVGYSDSNGTIVRTSNGDATSTIALGSRGQVPIGARNTLWESQSNTCVNKHLFVGGHCNSAGQVQQYSVLGHIVVSDKIFVDSGQMLNRW